LFVRSKQFLEACAQGRIAFAFGVEPRHAFRSGLAQCDLEHRFFADWVHGLAAEVGLNSDAMSAVTPP